MINGICIYLNLPFAISDHGYLLLLSLHALRFLMN
jgi:hypothetical protein